MKSKKGAVPNKQYDFTENLENKNIELKIDMYASSTVAKTSTGLQYSKTSWTTV